ncbi:metallophosphoesterase [Formosa sp. PL04]|uniref:STAND family AAA ATPase n=1 Tax=Formosa sp. PL04 TaxID=3081755 RepID=UPI0029819BE3|nr:metallophosphoesterase [Formosa sp. PL04]MDW5290920.1 metallophosphoesterase [Formosa sp. PL04]
MDLVVFTGDMIDKAGKDFGSVTNGLNKFKENIIVPIIQKLGLDITRFIICPGNHDIDRNADTKMDEIGIKGGLNTVDDINDFINNEEDNYDKINRIKEYKEFEIELYKSIVSDKLHSKFKFSLISEIRGKKIGVSSINSSWRCYGDSDNQNLLIGENQLNDNFKFIKDCDLKIALVHHQFDWLSEIEKSNIKNHFSSNFNLIFSGHVHQTESEFVKNVSGSSLRLISPSGLNNIREDNKNFVNGFSVLDYGAESICYFFKYNHKLKEFVKNTDVCPEGEWIIEVNSSNANSKTSDLILEDDFHDFLYDSGANFTHRSKKLLLDDIYVSPFLEQFSLIEQEERSMSTSLDNTFKKIINNDVPHLIFLGEENSGKTSLCKQLFKQLLSTENVLPVYIKGSDVKKVADKDIENLINRESRKQYKNDWSSPILRKVIIIDDYNNCTLPQKSKKNFLNYLHNSNYQTIVTWDEFFTLSELLESTSVSIEIYEVLKFGVKKRLELIRKWIDLVDEDFQNEQEKEFQINELFKVVNSVIGKNLVPSLPIYILTILQANELTSQTNFEQSTFGHYYDVLIKSAIGQIIKDNKEIEKYYSYLSELSYKIFCGDDYSCELTEDSLIDFHKFFTNQYRLNTSFRDAIETLEKSNLLVKINDSYKFRYKYIYFYFIGKYLSDNIEEEEVRDIVVKLSDKLYQTESANIYIFLSHHSKSKFIINQILERAQELFIDETVIGLNDDISYINSLIEKTTENLDFNNNRSIDEHKTEEYIDVNPNISEDITQEDKSYEIDSISKINKAFKTIEIMGYIIKNRYASLKGNDKEVLVEELYKLGLRSLTFLFRSLLEGEEFIKNEIIDIIRKDPNSTLTNREREGLAKQFMFNLLYMVSYSIFKRISTSISSKDLEITFRDVKSKFSDTNNNAVGLIDMAIIFEYSKSFPEANVGELAKDLKSNPFAFSILRRLGVNFMRMMPMKEIDQQKISEMLHISIKNQRFIGATSAISKKSN